MDRKKELKQQYKEVEAQAGVYQIKNTRNQKSLVVSTMNFNSMNGKEFSLRMGSHINRALQHDWTIYGGDCFVFEILEVLDKKNLTALTMKDALKKLEEKWLENLQPFGDNGYNRPKSLKS